MKRWYWYEREYSGAFGSDAFGGLFDSETAAINAAEYDWRYLTPRERKGLTIMINYNDIPDDVEREEVMDYVWENEGGGYYVAKINLENYICPYCGAEFEGYPKHNGSVWEVSCSDCHESFGDLMSMIPTESITYVMSFCKIFLERLSVVLRVIRPVFCVSETHSFPPFNADFVNKSATYADLLTT